MAARLEGDTSSDGRAKRSVERKKQQGPAGSRGRRRARGGEEQEDVSWVVAAGSVNNATKKMGRQPGGSATEVEVEVEEKTLHDFVALQVTDVVKPEKHPAAVGWREESEDLGRRGALWRLPCFAPRAFPVGLSGLWLQSDRKARTGEAAVGVGVVGSSQRTAGKA